MIEFTQFGRQNFRWALLTTASSLALMSYVSSPATANASDPDHPQVWIELGSQLEWLMGQGDPYMPRFSDAAEQHGLISPASVQTPPLHSFGSLGSVSFQPTGSEWEFIASVHYGRSNKNKHAHQELEVAPITGYLGRGAPGPSVNEENARTADYTVGSSESHATIDFQVGKDVGFGILGRGSNAQLDFGVRFAQFSSRSKMRLLADPDPHWGGLKYFPTVQTSVALIGYYQFYKSNVSLNRNFRGIGPSLGWKESVSLIGASEDGAELTFDWGANFSVLFGRQKVRIDHQTSGDHYTHRLNGTPKYDIHHYSTKSSAQRSHSVVVPNIGGLAGLSLRFPNANVSLGYRADFFFGAMDGGIDTRKTYDRNFHGPFATISIGLGG